MDTDGAVLCVNYMLNTEWVKEAHETVVVSPEALGALLRSVAKNTSQTSTTQRGGKFGKVELFSDKIVGVGWRQDQQNSRQEELNNSEEEEKVDALFNPT